MLRHSRRNALALICMTLVALASLAGCCVQLREVMARERR